MSSERMFKKIKAFVANRMGLFSFEESMKPSSVPLTITLTSSPARLQTSLPQTLQSLRKVTNDVRLVLPQKFRNRDAYDEVAVSRLGVHVVRIEEDWGPLTKALPTLESVAAENREDCVVIVVDDDAVYSAADLVSLAEAAHREQRIATGFARWDETLGVWVPFGNNAVAYPKSVVTDAFVKAIRSVAEEGGTACRVHDDMVLAVAAGRTGLREPLQQEVRRHLLMESFSEDALMYEYADKDAECAKQLTIQIN